MASIINKIKDAISGDNQNNDATTRTTAATDSTGNTYTTGTTGTAEGFTNPHSSRVANTINNPSASDMERSRITGNTTGTTGTAGVTDDTYNTGTTSGMAGDNNYTTGTTGTTGVTGDSSYNTGNTGTTGTTTGLGPHSSSLMNKVDPRVDSTTGAMNTSGSTGTGMSRNTETYSGTTGVNRDDSYTTGTTGTSGMAGDNTYSTGARGTSGMTGDNSYATGTTGTAGATGGQGPHSSSLMNKLDPRVDSTTGAMNTSTSTGTGMSGNAGSYSTSNTGGWSSSTPGQGTAQNTAGPHNSDLLNKLDPRVDSDMDGSRTVGGNQTNSGLDGRDPFNAAHVPPSVLRQSLGDPVITHDNPEHNHQGRHASLSHQEAHIHRGSEGI